MRFGSESWEKAYLQAFEGIQIVTVAQALQRLRALLQIKPDDAAIRVNLADTADQGQSPPRADAGPAGSPLSLHDCHRTITIHHDRSEDDL